MRQYVTLFDRDYAPQGLALYRSLERHEPGPFGFRVLALDDEAERDLAVAIKSRPSRGDASVTIIPVRILMETDRRLRRVWTEPSWTRAERCWASAPIVTVNAATMWPADGGTSYVDADEFFVSDPSPVWAELAGHDAALHEHRFSTEHAAKIERGKFCNGWSLFASTDLARLALAWWADMVAEECRLHMPEKRVRLPGLSGLPNVVKWGRTWTLPAGTAGDQGWLQAMPEFCEVATVQHHGSGLAPYNIADCRFTSVLDAPWYTDDSDEGFVVDYHFHESRFDRATGALVKDTSYVVAADAREVLYEPYYAAVKAAAKELRGT